MEELGKPQTVVSGAAVAAVVGLGIYVNDRLNKLDEKLDVVQTQVVTTGGGGSVDAAFQNKLTSIIHMFDRRIKAMSEEIQTLREGEKRRNLPVYERLTDHDNVPKTVNIDDGKEKDSFDDEILNMS